MAYERLSAQDSMFLHIEKPQQPQHVGSLGILEGGPLHDPCVVAYLLRPELFTGRRCNVAIEHRSEQTMGMTLVDWWGVTGAEANAQVMRWIDDDGFYDLLVERIGRL